MGRLDGKVALISGAARGQGCCEARLFAAEGATVVLADVLDDEGQRAADEIGAAATYRHLDVTDEAQWESVVAATVEAHGRIDVLVNNAGIFRIASLVKTTLDEYRRVIEVNQIGVFLGMRTVATRMIEQRSGAIVNISSVAGIRGTTGAIAYAASKFAVCGMTKAAALELAKFGVRANSVHPGLIDTPMLDQIRQRSEGTFDAISRRVPMRSVARPDDVAALVLFLASDESAYCTGSEFVVDGGISV
jgi:3alpha(or 20beta)-hydroxysteroid dehydrogenase